jgi:hypothetical protein
MTVHKPISILPVVFPLLLFFVFGFSFGGDKSMKASSSVSGQKMETENILSTSDTIYVIHFHPTAQCSCCINVGIFSRKGLEKFYAKPYQDGRIVFEECNIDEDSLTANKYQIFWSALGFMRLSKGENKFKEIESVWEFCEDEDKFLPNFKTELDQFLREDKKGEDSTATLNKGTVP